MAERIVHVMNTYVHEHTDVNAHSTAVKQKGLQYQPMTSSSAAQVQQIRLLLLLRMILFIVWYLL